MRKQEFSTKEFIHLLQQNGWKETRRKSSHITLSKNNNAHIITVVDHGKEMNRCLARKLLKEAGLFDRLYV